MKGFRALQRQMQALQEKMRRGMNLTVRDESEDEREEGQVNQEEQEEEEVLNQKKKSFSKPLPRLEKDLSFMFSHFQESVTQKS